MKKIAIFAVLSLLMTLSATAKTITLKSTNTVPATHPLSKAVLYMGEIVKERTDGEIEIKLFPNSQLGGNQEILEGVRLGTIEMVTQFAGTYASYAPEMEVLAMPFIFESDDHMAKALNGEAGDILRKALEKKGFYPLAYFTSGSRSMMNNKRPINSTKDLQGLKIRVIPVNVSIDAVNRMGAIATPMNQADVYSALQQGVLDGWENSPITLHSLKLYEVTKYFSWTEHFRTPDLMSMSKKKFDALSKEHQEIIKEAALLAMEYEYNLWHEEEDKTVEELKKLGVQFNKVENLQEFVDATRPMWDAYEKKYKNGVIPAILDAKK